MNDPHLVASAAGGDVKTLFEQFLIPQRERTVLSGVDQRNEHHVAFVSLELRGVSAKDAMEFVAFGRNMGADQVVDFDGLLIADQRNHPEAQGLAGVVLLVFGLFDRSGDQ